MIQVELCTICGQQLPGGDLLGYCPTCLLKAALRPQSTTGEGFNPFGASDPYPPEGVDSPTSAPTGSHDTGRQPGIQPDRWSGPDGSGSGVGNATDMTGSFTAEDHARAGRSG